MNTPGFRIDRLRRGKKTTRTRVFEAMASYLEDGSKIDMDVICEKTGFSPTVVGSTISKLKRMEAIARFGYGRYCLPTQVDKFAGKQESIPFIKTKSGIASHAPRAVDKNPPTSPALQGSPSKFQSSGFITPLSRDRLMGRRA